MGSLDDRTQKRVYNRLKIAREGLPFIGIGIALCLVLAVLDIAVPAAVVGVLTLFTIYFFRDPERRQDFPENTVVAPADGRILKIHGMEGSDSPLGEPATKVSIFMSVFNVHVNRIPASGRIAEIVYHPGRFFSANLDKASAENENNRIIVKSAGKRIMFVQIAGLIARRIACWIAEGDEVKAGQRFGLIRFGSRLDVYLPREIRVMVAEGQKVKAGETILGYLP
jgi:phosphatidylserine decarboxylase